MVAQARSAPNTDEVLRQLRGRWQQLDSLYVHYELFLVDPPAPPDRKLTVEEALDSEHHFVRTVHWYPSTIFPPSPDEALDPLRNWMLWRPSSRVQFWETTRRAIVTDGARLRFSGPRLQRFSSYLGVKSPEEELSAAEQSGVDRPLTAAEYYLPWALDQPGWREVTLRKTDEVDPPAASRSKLRELRRETPATVQTLAVDPNRDWAVVRRTFAARDGSFLIDLHNREFCRAGRGPLLPTVIEVRTQRSYRLELRARQIRTTDLPKDRWTGELPPGSLVDDRPNGRSYSLSGGEELLDQLVWRMRQVRLEGPHWASRWGEAFLYACGLLLAAGVSILALRRAAAGKLSVFARWDRGPNSQA